MKRRKSSGPGSAGERTAKPVSPAARGYSALLLVIVLASVISYWPAFHNGFVNYDDDRYVTNNPSITKIQLNSLFSSYFEGNYHPLTMLFYSIEYQLFGLDPHGFHTVSVALHLLNVALVFCAIRLLSNTEVAFVTALLFGVHPMHVESVAWVSELKDLLYSCFFLAAYICYLRFRKDSRSGFYWGSLFLFVASVLSKAMAVSLPVVLILTDYFQQRKWNVKVWIEKLPFFLISLIFGVVAIRAQKSSSSIQDLSQAYSFIERIILACYAFVTYIVKLVAPYALSAFYPYPNNGNSLPAFYSVYLLIVLALAAVVAYSLRFTRKIFFGFAFFGVTVFLVLQLLPVGNAIMADRYTYIPSIGIFYLAAEGLRRLRDVRFPFVEPRIATMVLLSVAAILFSAATFARCRVWQDGMTLWNDVIVKQKDVALAYNNRGVIWGQRNAPQDALADYSKAIDLNPRYAAAYNNRGVLLASQNRLDEALSDYSNAIRLKDDFMEAYNNRAMLQAARRRSAEALDDYNKVIELQPGMVSAYNDRGNLFLEQKQYDAAVADYRKTIELDSTYTKAYNGLGVVLMRQAKYSEAINQFTQAIARDGANGQAYQNRAIAEYYSGQKATACQDLQQALNRSYQPAADLSNQWCR